MARRRALAVLALLTLAASSAIAARSARAQETLATRVAWAVVELSTGRVIDSRDQDLLAQPVLPGSLVKVLALVALLEEWLTPRPALPAWGVTSFRAAASAASIRVARTR